MCGKIYNMTPEHKCVHECFRNSFYIELIFPPCNYENLENGERLIMSHYHWLPGGQPGDNMIEMTEDPEKEAALAVQLSRQFKNSDWYRKYVETL